MNEVAGLFISFLWLFGALLFWPALKFLVKMAVDKLYLLKWIFWAQVILLIASFSLVQYYKMAGYNDWMHSLMFPYVVGAISWVAVIIALFAMGISSRQKNTQ